MDTSRSATANNSKELFFSLQESITKQFDQLQQQQELVAKQQLLLQHKQESFDKVRTEMTKLLKLDANGSPQSRIKLSIGGTKFITTLDTLLMFPESFLGNMFSGKFKLEKDEEGFIFIDRDGTHFRYILNFLRTGILTCPDDLALRKELKIEAEFYQIQPLVEVLTANMNGTLHGSREFSAILCSENITLSSSPSHHFSSPSDPNTTASSSSLSSSSSSSHSKRRSATVNKKGTCRVLIDLPGSICTGRHYYEIRLDKLQNPNCLAFGVSRTTNDMSEYVGSNSNSWAIIVMNREVLKKWHSPVCEEYGRPGITFKEGDVLGLLLDYGASGVSPWGVLSFYLNGVWQGEAFNDIPPHVFPVVSMHSKDDTVTLLKTPLPPEITN